MRIDVFLKTCRLVKRRSVANDLCDRGRVEVAGARAKAGREVRPGDMLTLRLPRRRIVAEVVEVPRGNVPKEQASGLYRVIEDKVDTEGP